MVVNWESKCFCKRLQTCQQSTNGKFTTSVFPGSVPNLNLLTRNTLNLSTKEVVSTGWSLCCEWPSPRTHYEPMGRAPSKEIQAQCFFRRVSSWWQKLTIVKRESASKVFSQTPKLLFQVGLRMTHSFFHRMRAEFVLADPNCQVHTQYVSLECLNTENTHLS